METDPYLEERAVKERPLLNAVDAPAIVKVLLGNSEAELIKLEHVSIVHHAVSEDTLSLMDPQPCNL